MISINAPCRHGCAVAAVGVPAPVAAVSRLAVRASAALAQPAGPSKPGRRTLLARPLAQVVQ